MVTYSEVPNKRVTFFPATPGQASWGKCNMLIRNFRVFTIDVDPIGCYDIVSIAQDYFRNSFTPIVNHVLTAIKMLPTTNLLPIGQID